MEKNLLDVVSTTFDEKAHAIRIMGTFAKICQTEDGSVFKNDCKLVLFTPSARIHCMLCEKDDDSVGTCISENLQEVSNKLLQGLPADLAPVNRSQVISLKDVTVIPYATPDNPFSVQFMQIFSDQIIGISVG